MIEIIRPGFLALVEDLGRPGFAALGVSRSGAADPRALRLANRLVGNDESAAGLEITFGGFAARLLAPALLAFTGASGRVRVGTRDVGMNAPTYVNAGEQIAVETPECGLRTYVGIRGGITVPPVLGSRATDVLGKLGPPPLTSGMRLPVGRGAATLPVVDVAPVAPDPEEPVLRVVFGPRDDWFTPAARAVLCSATFAMTPASDRAGIRLEGPALERRLTRELPPEGMLGGALQVPPNGKPILFLCDHPVTGGYPVIAVVLSEDVPLAAQLRPGQRLRFRAVCSIG